MLASDCNKTIKILHILKSGIHPEITHLETILNSLLHHLSFSKPISSCFNYNFTSSPPTKVTERAENISNTNPRQTVL